MLRRLLLVLTLGAKAGGGARGRVNDVYPGVPEEGIEGL